MLDKLIKISWVIIFLIWPWQTRYFLVLGANEYLTQSVYVSDIVLFVLLMALIISRKPIVIPRNILKYFFIGLVPVAILAIAQFTLQTSFSTKWLGLANHDPAELGQVVIETASNERWLRAYGSFDHPNILGGVMAMALILLLLQSSKVETHCNASLRYIYTALFSSALFFSFSRAAWLGLLIGLIAYLGINFYKKEKIRKDFFIILIILYSLFSILYSGLVFSRLSASGRIEQKSINERVSYYAEAKELFLLHPFFGVGARNYVSALMELKPGRPAWSYQPVHNTIVLIFVEFGLIGVFIIFCVLWLFFSRKSKVESRKVRTDIISIFALMFTLMILDQWFWSLHVGWLFIGLVIVIGVELSQENK